MRNDWNTLYEFKGTLENFLKYKAMAFLAALLLLYYSVNVQDIHRNLLAYKAAYTRLPLKDPGINLADQIPTNYADLLEQAASTSTDDVLEGCQELFNIHAKSLNLQLKRTREEGELRDAFAGARREITRALRLLRGIAFKLIIITSPEVLIPCLSPDILNLFNPDAHPYVPVKAAKAARNDILATYISVLRDIVDGGHKGQKPITHVEVEGRRPNSAANSTPQKHDWKEPMKGPVYTQMADKTLFSIVINEDQVQSARKMQPIAEVCHYQHCD